MSRLKNPFAKIENTDELIHIDEYNEKNKSITVLKVVCPNCGVELKPRALESTKITKHFYHVTDCNCGGVESALHKYSKELFNKLIGRELKLPSQSYIALKEYDKRCLVHKYNSEDFFKDVLLEKIREIESRHKCYLGYYGYYGYNENGINEAAKEAIFDINTALKFNRELFDDLEYSMVISSCMNEKKISQDVISDAYLNNKLNIEIFVTHKINDIKAKSLKEYSIPTIEIDMSHFSKSKEMFCKESIIEFLLSDMNSKKFYNFKKYDEAIKNLEFIINKAFEDNFKMFLDEYENKVIKRKQFEDMLPKRVKFNTKYYVKWTEGCKNWGNVFVYDVTMNNGEKCKYEITQTDIFKFYVQEYPNHGYNKFKLKYDRIVYSGSNSRNGINYGDYLVFNIIEGEDIYEGEFWLTNKRAISIISSKIKL